MFRAYQEPHKASDSGCPSNVKAEISAISRQASRARIDENHLSTSSHSIPPTETKNESIYARSGYTLPLTEAPDTNIEDATLTPITH
jgi:hypothetical protein